MNNRRHFLRSLVLVGAALGARPIALFAGTRLCGADSMGAAPRPDGGEPLGHAAFVGALGSRFRLDDGTELVLDRVSPLARDRHTESFSLWLRNDANSPVVQSTHRFDHATMGSFEMFVVPKTQADGVAGCEAVFNQLIG